MFIEHMFQKILLAPAERNVADLASFITGHIALLERESGDLLLVYKHSAPPEPACDLVAAQAEMRKVA